MVRPSFWSLLAGEALACSNELCATFVLIAPSIQLCSRGAVMVLEVLFAASPRPLSHPYSLGVLQSTEADWDRLWQNLLTAATRSQPLVSSSAFLPRVGRAFPVLRGGVTKCQPMAQGSPCRAPTSTLPHGAAGVNEHSSILHPPTSCTQPLLAPSVSQPWIHPNWLSSGE